MSTRRTAAARCVAAYAASALAACGGSTTVVAPTPQPAPPVTTPAPAGPATFSGTWTGSALDSQGATTVSWSLTQTGETVSGSVFTQAIDPNDGSCNSCHRNKSGSVTGTISGSTMTLRMFFAAGVDGDPTPACSATLAGTATAAAEQRVTGRYTGEDTCEGPFLNGTLALQRQP